jgi:hypothetical protein
MRVIGLALVAALLSVVRPYALAQSAGEVTPSIRASTTLQDNLTYHRTNARLGWYNNETELNATNVATSAFHLIGTMKTQGKSYSQPLYVSNVLESDGKHHNVLIVTDSTDVVYAYDADTLALIWSRSFTGAGVRQQLASDSDCDDTWPNIGINGTPVIDRTHEAIYVVVPTYESGKFFLRLHSISLTSGHDKVNPTVITSGTTTGPQVSPEFNFNRAALLEANGTVYVSLSTHCDYDSGSAHGWLFGYNATTLAPDAALIDVTAKNIGTIGGARYLGSIWQGGFGIAADDNGTIYFATGNGANDGVTDFAMSVLAVPPSLKLTGAINFFTPSNWEAESNSDSDLGSGGVMLLPDQTSGSYKHLAIAGGKTGEKYLLNRDSLGGFHSGGDEIPYETSIAGGQFGGPAYFVDASGNQKILYGGSPSLHAYTLTTKPYALTLTSSTAVGSLENRNNGVTPVVSSNGTASGTAVVWTIMTPSGGLNGTGTITLYAFDGANLAHKLYSAAAGVWTGNGNTGGALITPLVANGRVYLATDGMVSVFGIN